MYHNSSLVYLLRQLIVCNTYHLLCHTSHTIILYVTFLLLETLFRGINSMASLPDTSRITCANQPSSLEIDYFQTSRFSFNNASILISRPFTLKICEI